jgi:hypothetical protein
MYKPTPSLDIIRPVLNIGETEIDRIQESLVDEDMEEDQRKRLRKLFKRPEMLHATLVSHAELLRLQQFVSWRSSVNDEHLSELSDYMESALPDFSQASVEVPTLPAELRPTLSAKGNFILTVAGSQELVHERLIAKQALCNFYRVKGDPERVWSDDTDTSEVWLASSYDTRTTQLLREVDWALASAPGLLPEVTELGRVAIRPNN